MTETFFKATRTNGRSFHEDPLTGRLVDYVQAMEAGVPAVPPPVPAGYERELCGPGVLHAATVPAETLVGGEWPCRLFRVEGTPLDLDYSEHPHKRGFSALRVVSELPAWRALGPNGQQVAALIDRARWLTSDEVYSLSAARAAAGDAARVAARVAAGDAARVAAGDAARVAAGDAAWVAAGYATWDAARDAAGALVVRDLIGQHGFTRQHFDVLAGPWFAVIGDPAGDKDGA